jgi:hypothetical protein
MMILLLRCKHNKWNIVPAEMIPTVLISLLLQQNTYYVVLYYLS